MKILLAGLIAGLLLSLSLSAKADSTTMKCTFAEGEDLQTRTLEVTNPAMTSMDFSTGAVSFTATAIYDSVNVYAKINGVTVGNTGKKLASLDVFDSSREPVSLWCTLIVHVDSYCRN